MGIADSLKLTVTKGLNSRHNYMILTEKQLIGKVRKLRQIRPRKDWVFLTKKGILGEEPGFLFFPYI